MVKSPSSAGTSHETLLVKYKVNYNQLLGQGGFASVYKGLDTESRRHVAVKVFNEDFEVEAFQGSVANWQQVLQSRWDVDTALSDPRESARLQSFQAGAVFQDAQSSFDGAILEEQKLIMMLSKMDLQRDCFVRLLGYSKEEDEDNKPGFDTKSHKMFMIFEFGDESLSQKLARHRETGQPLGVEELRSVQWGLVSIACALHGVNFVHMDIKPSNIVSFRGMWKLIDLDTVAPARSRQDLNKLIFTTSYLPPEIAKALNAQRGGNVEISRLGDVWSLGMCALETVILRPVLETIVGLEANEEEDHFITNEGETKTVEEGDELMVRWLCDESNGNVIEEGGALRQAISEINPEMCTLLEGMLAREPKSRFCISQCFVHPWFQPIRQAMWKELKTDLGEPSGAPGARGSRGSTRLSVRMIFSGKAGRSSTDGAKGANKSSLCTIA